MISQLTKTLFPFERPEFSRSVVTFSSDFLGDYKVNVVEINRANYEERALFTDVLDMKIQGVEGKLRFGAIAINGGRPCMTKRTDIKVNADFSFPFRVGLEHHNYEKKSVVVVFPLPPRPYN